MNYAIDTYKTLVFDCDGVVLNSNQIKTDAFYKAALPYGQLAAQALVDYHVQNGGVSRYKKFTYFLEHIVGSGSKEFELKNLLDCYASEVRDNLMICDIAPGLADLRKQSASARWMIVSGGDQAELREIFAARGIKQLFDGGIFGSPDTKDEILDRELASGKIRHPALFFGDSKYDYQVATLVGMDFLFVSGWSEVAQWNNWVNEENIKYVSSLANILRLPT